MKVKEENEKVGLKLNIQKTKIMASGPITSWQMDGETVETVSDFILGGSRITAITICSERLYFLGLQITADGDCSHEIKRHLLLGSKPQCSSVASDSLWSCGPQHARLPCPWPTPGAYSNSCPPSWWCHPAISSSVVPFSSHLQSFPASGSFPMSQFFTADGRIGVSESVLPMNIQDWFPLGLTGLISLQSKRLSRAIFSTTVQKHQFFSAQLSLQSNSHTHTWLLGKP